MLGAVAGFVDAVCFARLFHVFPANQSGNAILLGIGLGDGSAPDVWRPATAMVGFAFGVAGAVALRRSRRVPAHNRALIAVEILLLGIVALAAGSIRDVDAPLDGASGALLLLLAALAMGVQTEIIRSHAGVSIATTFQTGALTRIAEGAAGESGRGAVERRTTTTAAFILTTVLAGYIGGAALGTRLATDVGWAAAVPLSALAVLALTEPRWRPRSPAEVGTTG